MTFERITGDEPIAGSTLLEFWRWAFRDLAANNLRGLFAEWLVARACGVADGNRVEWDAVDLLVDGIKVEVKSSAYVQTWAQKKPSSPSFSIRATKAWDAMTGYEDTVRRQADVYVFCLLHERDRDRLDPLDLRQWRFYVLPTSVLDAQVSSQKSIGLNSLLRLKPVEVPFEGLHGAIKIAGAHGAADET